MSTNTLCVCSSSCVSGFEPQTRIQILIGGVLYQQAVWQISLNFRIFAIIIPTPKASRADYIRYFIRHPTKDRFLENKLPTRFPVGVHSFTPDAQPAPGHPWSLPTCWSKGLVNFRVVWLDQKGGTGVGRMREGGNLIQNGFLKTGDVILHFKNKHPLKHGQEKAFGEIKKASHFQEISNAPRVSLLRKERFFP